MKNVFITGGNRGIGLGITKQLIDEGYRVLNVHNSVGMVQSFLSPNYDEGICDVRDRVTLEFFVNKWKEKHGEFYAIVNNAGIAQAKPFEKITKEEWDDMMNINVKGAFNVAQIVSPHLEEGGRIVNISSVSGLQGMSGHAHYCASKFALQGLTQVLAKELKDRRITANTVNPGPVDTDMWKKLDKEYAAINHWDDSMKQEDRYYSKLLIKRMGTPEDVANVVSFLLKPESSYITGTSIKVCGGNLIG